MKNYSPYNLLFIIISLVYIIYIVNLILNKKTRNYVILFLITLFLFLLILNYKNIKEYFYINQGETFGSYDKDTDTLHISHNAGFYSCCHIRLVKILEHFNIHNTLPNKMSCHNLFSGYKNELHSGDLTFDYFETKDISQFQKPNQPFIKITNDIIEKEENLHGIDAQFSNYKNINFNDIKPFIDQYYSPSQKINDIIKNLENIYKIDYNNTCTVYYRSTDKVTETNIAPMNEFINKAELIKKNNPHITFLLQTDSSEFRDLFLNNFNNTIYLKEVDNSDRYIHSLYLLSSVIMMSKTKYIISGSGNVSIWIILYRGNALNTMQYLNHIEYSYGVKNPNFRENVTNYWV